MVPSANSKPKLNIVLVEPKIPQNTGNIARLTAGTDSRLHLIEPLAFSIDDKAVKRAGLDYWEFVDLKTHKSWGDFLESEQPSSKRLWFFSTRGAQNFSEVSYQDGDYLIFGSETGGLDSSFHKRYGGQMLQIPIKEKTIRSFNLANSVAIAIFEAKRRL